MTAKTLKGTPVKFNLVNHGLLTSEMAVAQGRTNVDFEPGYVTKFETLDGKNRTYSVTPPDKSNGSDDARLAIDCAALREWGIDPDTVEPIETSDADKDK